MVKNQKGSREKMKRVLVLDEHGFVGRPIREAIKKKGYRDFLQNSTLTLALLKEIKPDVVINAEAYTGGVHYVSTRAADVLHDCLVKELRLYRTVRKLGRFAKDILIVNLIPNCVYPKGSQVYRESQWLDGPVDKSVLAMGHSKRILQVLSECYFNQYGINSINFFVPNPYGPGDYRDPVLTHALNGMIIRMLGAKSRREPAFEIWGSGKPKREWIFIKDLAKIAADSLELLQSRIDPISMAQNRAYSITQTAHIIKKIIGYPGKLVFNTHYQDGVPVKIMDDRLFRKYYPDFVFTDLEKGIRDTVKYYLAS